MDTAYAGFISVHFEEEFSLYELRDAFAYPFGRSRTLAEDDAVIGIAHERKSASFKFAVEFRCNYSMYLIMSRLRFKYTKRLTMLSAHSILTVSALISAHLY